MVNRKFLTCYLCILLLLALACLGEAQALDIKILDSAGNKRVSANYSSTEKVGFFIEYNNPYENASMIWFYFFVRGPSGKTVFTHIGNIGLGQIHKGIEKSSIKNIPIGNFYEGSGKYVYEGKVEVYIPDVSSTEFPTETKRMDFYVYSPSLTLSYPANGARDLIDKPLTFRWVSSGATKYRVYVDDDKGFYNCLFQTGKGEYSDPQTTYFQYPTSPQDPRHKLAGGVLYWWKVEGLDSGGNVVAKTPVPFSFTLKETAPSTATKDLAVTDIVLDKESTVSELKFNVLVKNQGGTGISNTRVNLYVNGVPVIPYQVLDFINTGETKTLAFLGGASREKMVTVSAAVDFPDDNMKNNMLTETFTLTFEYKVYELAEVWSIIKKFIKDLDILKELEGYVLSEVTIIPEGDINKELMRFEKGKAMVVGAEIEVVK